MHDVTHDLSHERWLQVLLRSNIVLLYTIYVCVGHFRNHVSPRLNARSVLWKVHSTVFTMPYWCTMKEFLRAEHLSDPWSAVIYSTGWWVTGYRLFGGETPRSPTKRKALYTDCSVRSARSCSCSIVICSAWLVLISMIDRSGIILIAYRCWC